MTMCVICPLKCEIGKGETGLCKVRHNPSGSKVELKTYGYVTTAICGPVEQKPLYHFFPGMRVLSLGGAGCNMFCGYCQNFEISQSDKADKARLKPSDAVAIALEKKADAIAFTYSEPVVWFEYVMDVSRLAQKAGLKTILKTNAFATEDTFRLLCEVMDAVNIDVKGDSRLYKEVCGIDLPKDPSEWVIIRNLRTANLLCHLEVSTIVIPGYDPGPIFEAISNAVLYRDIPIHLLKFVPDFKMRDQRSPTLEEMGAVSEKAKQYFDFVYIDYAGVDNVSCCPACGEELLARSGIDIKKNILLPGGVCPACGEELYFKEATNV